MEPDFRSGYYNLQRSFFRFINSYSFCIRNLRIPVDHQQRDLHPQFSPGYREFRCPRHHSDHNHIAPEQLRFIGERFTGWVYACCRHRILEPVLRTRYHNLQCSGIGFIDSFGLFIWNLCISMDHQQRILPSKFGPGYGKLLCNSYPRNHNRLTP